MQLLHCCCPLGCGRVCMRHDVVQNHMVTQAEPSKALKHPKHMFKELRPNAIAHEDEVNDWSC